MVVESLERITVGVVEIVFIFTMRNKLDNDDINRQEIGLNFVYLPMH